MPFDFTPKNKASGEYSVGCFSWSFMLDAGLGLVLGTGEGFRPGQFVYITRPDGLCVHYNDGARVSAREAQELAKVARWIARVQEARIEQWKTIPAEEQKRMEADSKTRLDHGLSRVYKLPWAPETVQQFRAFADWAEKSGGFKIW
jgi:hypothetical protein